MNTGQLTRTDYLLLFVAVTVVSLFYFSFTANNLVVGFTSDDAVYLLLADSYSFRQTTDTLLTEFIRQQSQFPPLYPMLLGVLGGDSGHPALAANITVLTLLLCLVTATVWIWKETGNRTLTALTTLLLFVLPSSLVLAQELWSEFLFMLLLYSVFILAGRPQITHKQWLAIAVVIALATLTRSVGIALSLAFCVVLFHRKVKHGFVYATISLGPFLIWQLQRQLGGNQQGYITTLTDTLRQLTPAGLLELLTTRLGGLAESFLWLFSSVDTGELHHYFSILVMTVATFLALTGFVTRLRPPRLDAVFLVLYTGIILIWPYGDVYYLSRFLYPLLPLLFFYIIVGTNWYLGTRASTHAFAVLAAALFIVIWPSSTQFIQRGYAEVPVELKPYTRDRTWLLTENREEAFRRAANTRFILTALPQVARDIPATDCVYAFQISMVMLHTRRVTGPLPPRSTGDTEFQRHLSICGHVLALPMQDQQGNYPEYYPRERLSDIDYSLRSYYANPAERTGPAIHLYTRKGHTSQTE